MVDFLVDNWQIIVSVSLAVLTLIAQFAKRKVKGYTWLDYLNQCLLLVPTACSSAEKKFDNGSNKKKYVIDSILASLSNYVDLSSLSNDELKHAELIIGATVEKVLSSPQKKEVKK
jgi:hypothetical protein